MPVTLLIAMQLYGNPGGLAAYMRRLAEIFSSSARLSGGSFTCVSLQDSGWDRSRHSQPVSYDEFRGGGGSGLRFLIHALGLALRVKRARVIVGHIRLAPLAYAMRKLRLIHSYVLLIHGIEAWTRVNAFERLAARGAERIVSISSFTAQQFCEWNGLDGKNSSVIPLALGIRQCDDPAQNGTEERRGLNVLFVGRMSCFERYKGADELIEALALLPEREIRLTLVGAGDDVERLQRKALSLDVMDRAVFTGPIADHLLEEMYRQCDVFAMPSRGEGFGIVFLEAMRHGKPCIGASEGAIPEVISNDVDGFLVSYGDARAIARLLAQLHEDPALRSRLGRSGFEKVRSKFLFGHMERNWQALLMEHSV